MLFKLMLSKIALLLALGFSADTAWAQYGRFEGELILNMSEGDRDAIVVKAFEYIGPDDQRWPVPSNTIVNGASIPRPLWSLVGSPFTGFYRKASVIHDYYCEIKNRSWQSVHRMFFDAMRAGGVGEMQAKTMYASVYYFGPKWRIEKGVDGQSQTIKWQPEFDEKKFKELEKWVIENNPSIQEIEALVK